MTPAQEQPRVVSASREIAAGPGRIFELIADPAQQPRWDGNDNLAAAPGGQRVLLAPVAALAAGPAGAAQHGAIAITSDAGFTAPGSATGCACVTAGNGTPGSPYVIGPWAITAPSGGSSGWAIKIDNTGGGVTSSFTISGISANYPGVPFTDPVIALAGVNNPAGTTISNVSANGKGRGVELDSSSYVNLDQLSLNKMTGNSLFINGSSHIMLSNSKLKATADGQVPHNADGLYALNSADLSIGGVRPAPRRRPATPSTTTRAGGCTCSTPTTSPSTTPPRTPTTPAGTCWTTPGT
jgi:hypothetical protein